MLRFSDQAVSWLASIINERFGIDLTLTQAPEHLALSLTGNEREIRFERLDQVFHESRSDFACRTWRASKEDFVGPIDDEMPAPGSVELASPLIVLNNGGAVIRYDILGLIYWMLSRLEEVGRTDLDVHHRFPATASHAHKHGYLERPIVDEWLVILGQVIQRVWPQVVLKKHEFGIKVSHDVDTPSLYAFKSWPTIGRVMAGHLLKRRDFKAFVQAPYIKAATREQLHKADPFNTFEWLMDVSEANNLQSAFYFICGRTEPARDADYEPEHPVIRNLMRRIHERGHEIGLHPSYGTFQQPHLIKAESERLKRVCSEEGIEQDEWGGRMHYLRWEQPTTLRAWSDAGLDYDSTLGYADRPGFRCGTCHEYSAFDPVAQEPLKLRVRPLVVMECTVFDQMYLGLGVSQEAEARMAHLKNRCRMVGGGFSILWHNSYFRCTELRTIYELMVSP